MVSNLYRVKIEKESIYAPDPRPIYVIARSKDEALRITDRHIIAGLRAKSAIELGNEVSGIMFVGRKR